MMRSSPAFSRAAHAACRRTAGGALIGTACLLLVGCRMMSAPLDGTAAAGAEAARAAGDHRAAAPRTLAIELLFIRHDPDDPVLRTDLWNVVDEQACGVDLRRRLNANGLRAGVVSGPLPTHVAARFAAGWAVDDVPTIDAEATDAVFVRRSLQLLPGRRSEVITTPARPELVLLEDHDGEVRGGTFHDATTLVVLHAWPAADGRIRLEVEPEVRHGPLRRSWVGEDGMFRFETGQAEHRMPGLRLSASLPVGSMLVVGESGDGGSSVGEAVLRDRTAANAAGSRLLVIRPRAAAVDPMFGPADAPPPAAAAASPGQPGQDVPPSRPRAAWQAADRRQTPATSPVMDSTRGTGDADCKGGDRNGSGPDTPWAQSCQRQRKLKSQPCGGIARGPSWCSPPPSWPGRWRPSA